MREGRRSATLWFCLMEKRFFSVLGGVGGSIIGPSLLRAVPVGRLRLRKQIKTTRNCPSMASLSFTLPITTAHTTCALYLQKEAIPGYWYPQKRASAETRNG